MKKTILLSLALFLYNGLSAQIINKLSVDLNMIRYASSTVLHESSDSHEFSFINGFTLNYEQSDKLSYFLGIRNNNGNTAIHSSPHVWVITPYDIKGVEFRLGAKLAPGSSKKFYLNYGLELFGEFSEVQAANDPYISSSDLSSYKKTYWGLAPSIGLNFRMLNKVILFADVRFRAGHSSVTTDVNSYPPGDKFYQFSLDPINAFGLRLEL